MRRARVWSFRCGDRRDELGAAEGALVHEGDGVEGLGRARPEPGGAARPGAIAEGQALLGPRADPEGDVTRRAAGPGRVRVAREQQVRTRLVEHDLAGRHEARRRWVAAVAIRDLDLGVGRLQALGGHGEARLDHEQQVLLGMRVEHQLREHLAARAVDER